MATTHIKQIRDKYFLEMLGQSVQSFPSGLSRVDLIFLVENAFLERAKIELAAGRPISGVWTSLRSQQVSSLAYIFPAPLVRKDIPGFSRLLVSAYFLEQGSDFNETISQSNVTISKAFTETIEPTEEGEEAKTYNWVITEDWLVPSVTGTTVGLSLSSDYRTPSAELRPELSSRRISGVKPPNGASSIEVGWDPRISSVTRRNFGRFAEIDVTKTLVPLY